MNDSATPSASYRVLARKYRPATFGDLIGQDAMVRTISNAFESGRIPQAWILTGVRGVGKTTTARILARALNYEVPDGSVTAPTVKMPGLGIHCEAIMESRHLFPPPARGRNKVGVPQGEGSIDHKSEQRWEADERPEPRSLGLLPSGPDPVGEWLVHRQPPGLYIGRGGSESKRTPRPRAARHHPVREWPI